MNKVRLKSGPTGRINTEVQAETHKNVLLVAVETNRTVSAATDWLLRMGVREYLRIQKENSTQAEDSR